MRLILAFTSLSFVIALSGCQTTSESQSTKRFEDGKRVLTVSTCLSRAHDQIRLYKKFFHPEINRNSSSLKLKYHVPTDKISRHEQSTSLENGTFDLLICPSISYARTVKAVLAAIASNKSISEIRRGSGMSLLQNAWSDGLNARIVAWPESDPYRYNIYLKRHPKLSAKTGISLSGFNIRSNALYRPFLEALGATHVTVKFSEIPNALRKNTIDGFIGPNGAVTPRGWRNFVKVRINPGFFRPSLMLIVNNDTYNSLSTQQRRELDQAGLSYERKSNSAFDDQIKWETRSLKSEGIEIFNLDASHAKKFLSTVYSAQFTRLERLEIDDFEKLKTALFKPDQ